MGGSVKLKKIAITGGIASGKSTVCHLFEEFGAYFVSADEIVHQLLVPTTQLGSEIITLLGDDIVVEGSLCREKIAQKVFRYPHLLRELEKRIHPEVQKVIDAQYKTASQKKAPLFIAEVPLLYEANLEAHYDYVIVVTCDDAKAKERFRNRLRYDEEEFLLRHQRLMPIEEKINKANFVIINNGSLKELHQTIQFLYNDLKENIWIKKIHQPFQNNNL